MNSRSLFVAGGVLLAACGVAYRLTITRQPPPVFHEPPATFVVDALHVAASDYPIFLETRGQVVARTQTGVVPEVSGNVVEVGPHFREGGFFEKGDLLLKLDDRDYKAALATAQSNLATAQTALAEETARAGQALEDWKSIRGKEPPPPLVAREPQLREAQAKEAAMRAQVARAEHDLSRTVLTAPYKGRVLEKTADVGQYVASGREVGKIFAVDYAEVRVPIADQQLAFVDFPEAFHGDQAKPDPKTAPLVKLHADVAGQRCEWEARIVRTSATVDSESLQSYVTVQVEDPYGRRPGNSVPLKVGQWVEAVLPGKTLRNVIRLPRSAVRDGNEVLMIADGNELKRRTFTRAWADQQYVLASAGLNPGEVVCTTPLSFAVEGAAVTPVLKEPPAFGKAPAQSQSPTPAQAVID